VGTEVNDDDRSKWVANDEGLYRWWLQSRLPERAFVRQHRADIDAVAANINAGTKPAHYLAYGPRKD
jgi:hypothetical protein